jgi:hypothetical protein
MSLIEVAGGGRSEIEASDEDEITKKSEKHEAQPQFKGVSKTNDRDNRTS